MVGQKECWNNFCRCDTEEAFRLKTFMCTMMLIVVFSLQNFCSARIAPSRMYLGGLNLNSSMHDVIRIYGNPARTVENNKVTFHETYDHYWGNGSFMVSQLKGKGILMQIYTNANNGIRTADGVRVGMDRSVIFEIYGKPDATYVIANVEYLAYYPFQGSQTVPMAFGTRNGKIVSISIHSEA